MNPLNASRRYRNQIILLAAAFCAAPLYAVNEKTPEKAPFVEPAPAYDPAAPVQYEEAERAIPRFKKPADLKVRVWAAEPQVSNPVAFNVDPHGRVWLVETNRYRGGGVLDIRNIYDWIEEDLACRNVADREAMVKRRWPDSWQDLTKNSDKIRLLEDSSKGGRCDKVTIWADGFNNVNDGIAAGVLERKGTVYFTDMPNLWALSDPHKAGVATDKKVLSTGYGIRYSFEGHDLHGLRFGPEGKLYFSCGDRGFSVKTKEGAVLDYPDTGGVLRCDPDGANLEVFATGLRNPQKLCFDEHGNLFTGDNNSDHGDPAKWFYVVEGADCGWRVGYQHITYPRATGALLMEDVMATEDKSTQLYMTPPIAHIGNGPSGCIFYPGTGMPESFRDHFLMCDFKGGTTNSGIWSFTMKPRGASFTMEDKTQYVWQILSTDVEWAPAGGFFATDWINGWAKPNKGRIYRFFNEGAARNPVVSETAKLLDEGFEKRDASELTALLSHADQRVRQEAQFELADRGASSIEPLTQCLAAGAEPKATPRIPSQSQNGFNHDRPDMARVHALWALGQIARKFPAALNPVVAALANGDAEIRAQAAKVIGDHPTPAAYGGLIKLLNDDHPRTQFFAAMALGRLSRPDAVPALLDFAARTADKDAYLRHAAVMALTNLHDTGAVIAASNHPSPAARLVVALTLRRWQRPEVAAFLTDADPRVVLEAARAIDDVPIEAARPELAKLLANHKLDEKVLRRALNANFREGKPKNVEAIAAFSAASDAPASVRVEAIDALNEWQKPSIRDHIMGLIWPLPEKTRDEAPVDVAAKKVLAEIVRSPAADVSLAGLRLAEKTGVEPLDIAFDLLKNDKASAEVRAEAMKVLVARKSDRVPEALKFGMTSRDPIVRREAIRQQTALPDAVSRLTEILAGASPADQSAVFSTLPQAGGEAADKVLLASMDKLLAGSIPPAARLDLLDAAGKSKSAELRAKVKQYDDARAKTDTLAEWRECLEGGDPALGKKIFFEKQEVSCVRCHMIKDVGGGNVGPNLGDIGKRQGREYILESIVLPNAKIAPGFESASIKLNDGKFYTGVVKSETEADVKVDTGSDLGVVTVKKADIKWRKPAPSPMPDDIAKPLSKRELRDLVSFLAAQQG